MTNPFIQLDRNRLKYEINNDNWPIIPLLAMAFYQDTYLICNDRWYKFKKGDFIISERQLAKTWKTDRSHVRRLIKKLELENSIIKEKPSKRLQPKGFKPQSKQLGEADNQVFDLGGPNMIHWFLKYFGIKFDANNLNNMWVYSIVNYDSWVIPRPWSERELFRKNASKKTTGGSKNGKNSDPPKNLENASNKPSKANETRANIYHDIYYNKERKNPLFEGGGFSFFTYLKDRYLKDITSLDPRKLTEEQLENALLDIIKGTSDEILHKAVLADNSIYYNLVNNFGINPFLLPDTCKVPYVEKNTEVYIDKFKLIPISMKENIYTYSQMKIIQKNIDLLLYKKYQTDKGIYYVRSYTINEVDMPSFKSLKVNSSNILTCDIIFEPQYKITDVRNQISLQKLPPGLI